MLTLCVSRMKSALVTPSSFKPLCNLVDGEQSNGSENAFGSFTGLYWHDSILLWNQGAYIESHSQQVTCRGKR
jgi:hypothetical protein